MDKLLLITILISSPVLAKSGDLRNELPSKNFSLIKANTKHKNTEFWITENKQSIILKSNVSKTWGRGIYFMKEGSGITVPSIAYLQRIEKNKELQLLWEANTVHGNIVKYGMIKITRPKNDCQMVWDFRVSLNGASRVNDQGIIHYSCPKSQLKPSMPKIKDLLPKLSNVTQSSTLTNRMNYALQKESSYLKSCIYRNINRPATLVDANRYSTPPQGTVSFEIDIKGGGYHIRTKMNDSIMVSSVTDVIGRSDLAKVIEKEQDPQIKYLVFDVDCAHAEDNEEDRKYDCKIGFGVYDSLVRH